MMDAKANHAAGPWAWFNGEYRRESECAVPIATHGLHYATACFEGIRSYARTDGGIAIFQLSDHVDRLYRSADTLGMEIPFDREELTHVCAEIVSRNGFGDAYIRPLVFLGEPMSKFAKVNMRPSVAILAFPWSGIPEADRLAGRPAKISPIRRPKSLAQIYKAKASANYLLATMARNDAGRSGVSQSIFLDESGTVCEAITDNLFFTRNGEVFTPSEDLPILAGLTRKAVIRLLHSSGITVHEGSYTVDELLRSDEIFTTSTSAGVVHIPSLDGNTVGGGRLGPIAAKAHALFGSTVRSAPC